MSQDKQGTLAFEMEEELCDDILPFWPRFIDRENGGFHGRAENDGRPEPRADKGLVMHERLLWTYSAAARLLNNPGILATADAAYRFLVESLYDEERKGFYFACDERNGGYSEAVAPDWSRSVASALGEEDIACAKSMNTNLHVLEALTSLHAALGDAEVALALRKLIEVHLERIVTPSAHLGLYFNNDCSRLDAVISYGHDIEGSWLLTDAAECIGDEQLGTRVRQCALGIAAAIARVLDEHQGSLCMQIMSRLAHGGEGGIRL